MDRTNVLMQCFMYEHGPRLLTHNNTVLPDEIPTYKSIASNNIELIHVSDLNSVPSGCQMTANKQCQRTEIINMTSDDYVTT